MNSYHIKYDSAKTLVQESFLLLWRNFEGLLFFNEFHKRVEVTVSIFESALGNGRKCLAREKSFISSGAPSLQKLQCDLRTFFYIKVFKDLQASLYSSVFFFK